MYVLYVLVSWRKFFFLGKMALGKKFLGKKFLGKMALGKRALGKKFLGKIGHPRKNNS